MLENLANGRPEGRTPVHINKRQFGGVFVVVFIVKALALQSLEKYLSCNVTILEFMGTNAKDLYIRMKTFEKV